MIHPHTVLKHISPDIGYAVFAAEFIPAGTITYVKDKLEIDIDSNHELLNHPVYGPLIDKFAYREPGGRHIIGWDLSKYVNHSCNANTISTGYGFEIALRDIQQDEQLTDDYGLFNISQPMRCHCNNENCRQTIEPSDIDRYAQDWDCLIKEALAELLSVPQPLIDLLDPVTRSAVMDYAKTGRGYQSVSILKHCANLKCDNGPAVQETAQTAIDLHFPLAGTT